MKTVFSELNAKLIYLLDIDSQLARAESLARFAHQKQKRKYTDDDYIIHPEEIVGMLRKYTKCKDTLAAAWLHDVVEDTFVSQDDIDLLFNKKISSYVKFLTEPLRVGQGNRKFRKDAYIAQLLNAPPQVKLIKLIDINNNIFSIFEHDKSYAPLYLKEKIDFLNVLTGANHEAYEMVEKNLRRLLKKLSPRPEST